MKEQPISAETFWPALLADVIGFTGLFTLLRPLASRFADLNGTNALIMSLGFVVFCVGVYLLRRLRPLSGKEDEWASRGWRVGMAIFFAIIISLTIAWQLGFFESGLQVDTRDLGEGGSAIYFVFAPGAWLGFSFLYVLVLAFSVTPRIEAANSRRSVLAFISLIAANIMLLLLSAQIQAIIGGRSLLWLLVVFVGLLLLFLPPRLIYTNRQSNLTSPSTRLLIGSLVLLVAAHSLAAVLG